MYYVVRTRSKSPSYIEGIWAFRTSVGAHLFAEAKKRYFPKSRYKVLKRWPLSK